MNELVLKANEYELHYKVLEHEIQEYKKQLILTVH